MCFENICCGLPFHSFNGVFQRANVFLILMKLNLSNFSFMDSLLASDLKKPLSKPKSSKFSILFFRNFIVLSFTFSSVIHFELIFTKSVSTVFIFAFSHVNF